MGLLAILIIGLTGCSNSESKTNRLINKDVKNQTLTKVNFKSIRCQAILIGDSIRFLDNNLNVVDDISEMTTKYVEITGISDTLFNDTKEICDAYWFVRIKFANKEGIVNGRQVFKIEESFQDTTFSIDGRNLQFLTTKCLAMGIEYQGDLMACPVDQPVIIKDGKNNFNGLINVISNDYYKKAIDNQDFQYFQLRNDDGYSDRIAAVTINESGIKLSIHRGFQEGENDYEVLLRYDQGKYTAEYLNYGEIKYE